MWTHDQEIVNNSNDAPPLHTWRTYSPVKYFLRDQIFFSFIPGDSDHENISALSQWWLKSRRLNGLIKILNLTINCRKILHTTHPFTDFFISPHVCPLTIFSSQALNLLLYTMHTILASKFGIYREIMSQDFKTRTLAGTGILSGQNSSERLSAVCIQPHGRTTLLAIFQCSGSQIFSRCKKNIF